MQFCPSYLLAGASSLPLDVGYILLVGSNILLSMVVQHQVVILEFSQKKMRVRPSTLASCMGNFGQSPITLNGVLQEIFWCRETLKPGGERDDIDKRN